MGRRERLVWSKLGRPLLMGSSRVGADQLSGLRSYRGMTRAEIEGLKVGDVLERTLDLVPHSGLKAKPNARYGMRGAVTEISYRGISVQGRAYVGGYTAFGSSGSSMSFSVSEGEEIVRFAVDLPAP